MFDLSAYINDLRFSSSALNLVSVCAEMTTTLPASAKAAPCRSRMQRPSLLVYRLAILGAGIRKPMQHLRSEAHVGETASSPSNGQREDSRDDEGGGRC
jgi:hypothetical protein